MNYVNSLDIVIGGGEGFRVSVFWGVLRTRLMFVHGALELAARMRRPGSKTHPLCSGNKTDCIFYVTQTFGKS